MAFTVQPKGILNLYYVLAPSGPGPLQDITQTVPVRVRVWLSRRVKGEVRACRGGVSKDGCAGTSWGRGFREGLVELVDKGKGNLGMA